MTGIDIFSVISGAPPVSTLIPPRNPNAIVGSTWIALNMNLDGPVREQNILNEFVAGNIPDFLRNFTQITVTATGGTPTITYLVMTDVLCIGQNNDYVRMPMNPHTAQAIANQYDCTLPTRKMVNDIWSAAANKLEPKPWGPPFDGTMLNTYRIGVHNTTIQNQLAGLNSSALISGHKKDVVLTNRLAPNNPNKRVAIYGWIQTNGQAIQGLNPVSHEDTYADYSHGIRMIANDVMVNGNVMRMKDVFADPALSVLVSDEGPLTFTSY